MKKLFLIYLLTAALFVSIFPVAADSAVLLDRVVATVNEEVITWSELMNVITLEGKTFLEGVSEDVRKERIRELERPFLKNLVEMKLQLQEARKMRLEVGGSELESAVTEIKEKFGMTEEGFLNSLKAEGLTMKDYKRRLSDQILLQKVVNFAVKAKVVVSDREIEEYYEANKENFSGKERVKIRQIFFAVPEEEDQQKAIEEKARELHQRIVAGEEFAQLASEFSEDPSNKIGGDLGYITRGSVLEEIENNAFDLAPGEVSSPFRSPAGLHIIKVEDRIKGDDLGNAKDKVREIIYNQNFEAQYHRWKTGLRENSYVDIKL